MTRFLIRSVLLLLIAFQLRGQYVYENVVFQKVNEISLTRSEWKIACVYEIKAIINYVNLIGKEIGQVHKIIAMVEKDYRQNAAAASIYKDNYMQLGIRGHSGFSKTFGQMRNEIVEHSTAYKRLQSELESYAFLSSSSRERRSLIPIVGRVLSGMFGLATESQVRSLRTGIKNLAANQETIYHQVESQMSMINASRKYITENRQAINRLVIGVQQVDMKLENISQILVNDLNTIARFVQIFSQLDLALQTIKRMIDSATRYIDHLRLELSFLAIGHASPNLFTAEELTKILFQIKSRIPTAFRLPSHPGRKLWSYFRTLNCAAVIQDKALIILVTIPLVDANDRYQLYEIHNLAYPDPFGKPLSSGTNMLAQYQLESDALMVNTYRTEYIFITREELHACSHSEGHYCNAQRARLPISKSKTCVIGLFMKNVDNIKRYCIPEIYYNVHLPRAVHLKDGIYAVSTKEQFSLSLTCQVTPDNAVLVIKPPLTIIQLQMTCSAHNQEITLSPYFITQTTTHPKNEPFFALLQESNFSEVRIWQPFISSLPNFSAVELPNTLKTVDKIPMSEFIDRFKSFQRIGLDTSWQFPFWAKILVGILILIILAVLYKFRRHIASCLPRRGKQESPSAAELKEVITKTDVETSTKPENCEKDIQLESTNRIKSIYPTLDLTIVKKNESIPGTSSP